MWVIFFVIVFLIWLQFSSDFCVKWCEQSYIIKMIIAVIIWWMSLFLLKEASRGDKAYSCRHPPSGFPLLRWNLAQSGGMKKQPRRFPLLGIRCCGWTGPMLHCSYPPALRLLTLIDSLTSSLCLLPRAFARQRWRGRGHYAHMLSVCAGACVPAVFDISEGYIGWELERVSTSAAVPALLL